MILAKNESKTAQLTKSKSLPQGVVVTILGHIDHGKTSILDAIRETKETQKEFGGITQHLKVYEVEFGGKRITFIDTPGHEVFAKMRSRGAKFTDLALLVVAADDGVMPQTKECIKYIKDGDLTTLVAINKVDLNGVNIEKVKNGLQQEGLSLEGFGGNVPIVEVSAKTGQGIKDLLEMILLLGDMAEAKKGDGAFEGIVLESYLDRKIGPLALVLVRSGFLKIGDKIK